jgi:hypothetical protein
VDDTKQFANECAVFFREKMFTSSVTPDNLGRRIDAVVYLMAQDLMSSLLRPPTIEDAVMGTHGPTGGPHFGLLINFLRDIHLPADFINDMPRP